MPARRSVPVTIVLAVVAAGGLGASSCSGRGPTGLERRAVEAADQRSQQARAAARQAGLPPDVVDFVAGAARASGARFTVTYDLSGRRATFAQRPPFRRLVVEDAPVAGDAEAAIVNAAGSFSCRRAAGAWSCQPDGSPTPPVGALSVDDMVATVQSLTASSQRFDLRVERTAVAGTAARCLVATPRPSGGPADAPQRLCTSAQGAPLLVESAGQTVRAVSYRASARNGDFDLPARPLAATSTSAPTSTPASG